MKSEPDPGSQLEALRRVYAQRLPGSVTHLEHIADNLMRGRFDAEALGTLVNMAHKLRGSGAIYGFARVSEAAQALEAKLQDLLESGRAPDEEERLAIGALLADLHRAVVDTESTGAVRPAEARPLSLAPRNGRALLLLERDHHLGEELALQVGMLGYSLRSAENVDDLLAARARGPAEAVLVDVAALEPGPATDAVLERLRAADQDLPVLLICSRDDLASRLAAVRAGGHPCITRPIDVAVLMEKLAMITGRRPVDPYRVLIVEDDAESAAFYAETLREQGMIAAVVTDPLKVMEALVEFGPDLLVLDLYMPQCSGTELATIIRHEEGYAGLPIVFLSSETDPARQREALLAGGDDFLTKPIDPRRLAASVSMRARRARALRDVSARDNLTGLLDRPRLREQLAIEITRAQRHKAQLAVALIDIDGFREINRRYGHLVGDRVIRSLGRLLRYRLRRSDLVGRHGADEFAVLLSDTDGRAAARILAEIRQSFAAISQQSNGDDLHVTFSAGVATYPACQDEVSLIAAADAALQQARRAGKVRIVVA